MIYPFSFSDSSSAAVTIGTSGCAAFIVATPSGEASKHKKMILVAPDFFSRSTAATEEFPYIRVLDGGVCRGLWLPLRYFGARVRPA